jgi:hypothetical protein
MGSGDSTNQNWANETNQIKTNKEIISDTYAYIKVID